MKIKGINTKLKIVAALGGKKAGHIWRKGTARDPKTLVMFHFLVWVADMCFTITYTVYLW